MNHFQETLSYLLVQVCKAHRGRTAALLSAENLHCGQDMILLQLWQAGGLTQSELAERLTVEPPTITKMVQRMERAGLLDRRPDPDDARVSRVFLTDEGRSLQQHVETSWNLMEKRTTANLTTEERMLLRRLLRQVLSNLT